MRWAAILAGGSGTRFWPVSTPTTPKQFLPLAGSEPLIRDAVSRLSPLIDPERVLIITGRALAAATAEICPEIPAANILAEPRAAYTAPALVWATHEASRRDPNATVLSLHADWSVGDDARFRTTAEQALAAAEEHDALVTVGIVPTRAEIGYGYIQPGDLVAGGPVRRVLRFTEKPDAARAEQLIAGGALWNSGLFAWTAQRFAAETAAHAPEIAPHVALLDAGDVVGFFAAVTPIVIDISHFERSGNVVVLPGDFPWDDVGTWSALARIRGVDEGGNCYVGNVVGIDSEDCVVWSDDHPIVLSGTRDLVVVRANNVTLVTTRERASRLKDTLELLPDTIRSLT